MASEVSSASDVLIRDSEFSRLAFTAPMRKLGSKYSVLSAILTRRDDICLSNIRAELEAIEGAEICCLLYDGCVVRCRDYGVRADVRRALMDGRGRIGISTVIKPWWSPRFDAIPISASLVLSGDASFGAPGIELFPKRGVKSAFLFNAVSYLAGDGVSPEAPLDGPFCVKDFNEISLRAAHGSTATPRLKFVGFEDVAAGDFVAYVPLAGHGHFFGVRAERSGGFVLLDEVCMRPVHVVGELFLEKLRLIEGSLIFSLNWGGRRFQADERGVREIRRRLCAIVCRRSSARKSG